MGDMSKTNPIEGTPAEKLHCAYCDTPAIECGKVIVNEPDTVAVCDECIVKLNEMLYESVMADESEKKLAQA